MCGVVVVGEGVGCGHAVPHGSRLGDHLVAVVLGFVEENDEGVEGLVDLLLEVEVCLGVSRLVCAGCR